MVRLRHAHEALVFRDRREAGQRLAARLADARAAWPEAEVVVTGLPRGGVPVAYEVAQRLSCPLDVILVRKLGVPGWPELAMGAIGEDGVRVLDGDVLAGVTLAAEAVEAATRRERATMAGTQADLRSIRPRESLVGKCAIIVDDGAATGSTARAACQVARAHGAARVIVAVPVAPGRALDVLRDGADEVIALSAPTSFRAVGQFYDDFSSTSDQEVRELLLAAAENA